MKAFIFMAIFLTRLEIQNKHEFDILSPLNTMQHKQYDCSKNNNYRIFIILVMSKELKISLLFAILVALVVGAQRCRFAHHYTADQVLKTPQPFLQEFIHWETKFMKEVGTQESTGLTYDGYRLDIDTGKLLAGGLHYWTASSKQSIQVGIFANILYTGRQDIYTYPQIFQLLKKKTQTFEQFYHRYPGFGGYLPWVFQNGSYIVPTNDFMTRVPALDNGELFWAALAVSQAWEKKHKDVEPVLRQRWDNITWKLMLKNAKKIFYNTTTGRIRAVASIKNVSYSVEDNTYWNNDYYYLDDPYQGQLFAWACTLFPKQTGFTEVQVNAIWQDKRNKLKSVNYYSVTAKANITVEKGWWFSAHEQWKNLFMPYSDVQIYRKIQRNNEKARTWNSVDKHLCGMFASVTGPAKNNTQNMDYYSDCGVDQISFEKVRHTHMVTPYSVFPLFLVSRSHAAVWLYNMLYSPAGQTVYGALQATSIDGKDISPVMTWDSKITTVLAVLGGNRDIVREFMIEKNIYQLFKNRIQEEYSRQFTHIEGEFVDFALPSITVKRGRSDFPNCKV